MDPLDLSAIDLLDAFGAVRLSPVEVAEAALRRVEERDGALHAFCHLDPQRTLADARASERRWRAGDPAGALDGVPVAVKDVFLTRGWPTRRGSRAVDAAGPWEVDAPAVAALRRHGAVLLGKTTTPEIGWKGVTDSPLEGVTGNPWDPSRTSGGSSGGSAAALASGMAPLALGTDGGGSIRIPCGFCGLPGIKPTFGRVPAWPLSPFGLLSHCGPMARTVADLALALEVLSEPDARDWTALAPAPSGFATDRLGDGVRGWRIAFSPDLGHVAVEPDVAAAVAAAADAFTALGAHVEVVDPGLQDAVEAFDVLWTAGAANAWHGLGGPDPAASDPGLVALAARGREIDLASYQAAMRTRDALGERMSRFHTEWDVLLTPTLPLAAFATGHDVPPGSGMAGWPDWTPFTYPFNVTQQPAATVPCGFTRDGLPVGLQIVGPRHADGRVLRAAAAYEAAHPQPTVAPVR